MPSQKASSSRMVATGSQAQAATRASKPSSHRRSRLASRSMRRGSSLTPGVLRAGISIRVPDRATGARLRSPFIGADPRAG